MSGYFEQTCRFRKKDDHLSVSIVGICTSFDCGGSWLRVSYNPRCINIFLISVSSSIKAMTFIAPWHLGHSTTDRPDKFSGSGAPSFYEMLLMTQPMRSMPAPDHRFPPFCACPAICLNSSRNNAPSARPCWGCGSPTRANQSSASNVFDVRPSLDR
jgi:hypothetical protein